MDSNGPVLLYDKNYKRLQFSDEKQLQKAIRKLFALLPPHYLDEAEAILRKCFSFPRLIRYIEPHYHIENFGPLHLLGTGGFGSVFKAVHKLDKKEYAIKVIDGIRSRHEMELARSEVCLMARLSHENIIQYITSWIEYGFNPPVQDEDNRSMDTRGSRHARAKPSSHSHLGRMRSRASSHVACPMEQDVPSSGSSAGCEVLSSDNGHQLAVRGEKVNLLRGMRLPSPTLFIQLELCQYNLAQWLGHRNERYSKLLLPSSSTDRAAQFARSLSPNENFYASIVPHAPARWLSDQIARGVAYLHSEQMMHRDLKPENVLLCGPPLLEISEEPCSCNPGCLQRVSSDSLCTPSLSTSPGSSVQSCYHRLVVKICDFGLARFLSASPAQRLAHETFAPNGEAEFTTAPSSSRTSYRPCSEQSRNSDSGASSNQQSTHSSRSASHHTSRFNHSSRTWSLMNGTRPTKQGASERDEGAVTPFDLAKQFPFLLTANLGSTIYAAPEVNARVFKTFYDFKADIFSMGVIFLQLFYPFRTLHELVDCLQDVSDASQGEQHSETMKSVLNALPANFISSWPEESQTVARMLNKQPDGRPSALELLYILSPSSEFPDLIKYRFTSESITKNTQNNHSGLVTNIPDTPDGSSLTCPSSTHRAFDLLLWRTRELERENSELRRRLSLYESV